MFLYTTASGNDRFLYLWIPITRTSPFVGSALYALLSSAHETQAALFFVLSDGLRAAPRCIFSMQNRGEIARNCVEKK